MLTEKEEYILKKFSYSKITSFYHCARNWSLHYLYQIKSEASTKVRDGENLHDLYEKLSTSTSEETTRTLSAQFRKQYPVEFMKYDKIWRPYRQTLPRGIYEFFEVPIEFNMSLSTGVPVNINGRIDYLNLNAKDRAIVLDFKSGAYLDNPSYRDQAALYAQLVFHQYPEVQVVQTGLFDISSVMERGLVPDSTYEFQRDRDLDRLGATTGKLIIPIIDSVINHKYPITPCFQCRYCPDVNCPFNKLNDRVRAKIDPHSLPPGDYGAGLPNVKKVVPKDSIKSDIGAHSPPTRAIEDPLASTQEELSIKEYFGLEKIGDRERLLLAELKQKLAGGEDNEKQPSPSKRGDPEGSPY